MLLEDVDGWIRHGHDLLKTEMDGFEESRGVVTILTTNHPEQLPVALIERPGRFHDVINFDLPDESIRKAMFSKWAPDIDAKTLEVAVAGSEGMSGAHVYELCSFAKGLSEFDEVSASEAMERALRKLTEQRELLGVHQKGFDLLQRRPSGGGGGDSKAITQALTNLVAAQTAQTEAQTEQMVVTRQLLDTIQDLSRKVVSIHAPSEPTGSGAGGDSGDDFETDAVLRIVSAYGQVQV